MSGMPEKATYPDAGCGCCSCLMLLFSALVVVAVAAILIGVVW